MGKIGKIINNVVNPHERECGCTAGGTRCTNRRRPGMEGCSVEHATFNMGFGGHKAGRGWLQE